jgi:hypothetical protein
MPEAVFVISASAVPRADGEGRDSVKARENWPFYDEAPAVARRGSCKP